MICILSQSALEPTTEDVIDWLKFWQIPYIRLNGEDIKTAPLSISMKRQGATLSWQIADATLDPARIKVVWLRRWRHEYFTPEDKVLFADTTQQGWQNTMISADIHLRRDMRTVSAFIFDLLSSARWLTEPHTSTLNKLHVLKTAAECGIDIPDTLVSTDPSAISAFIAKYNRVVTKPLGETFTCSIDGRSFATYTSMVDKDALVGWQSDLVFPMLFQECLDKEYEIRAFYLDGRFNSMAIFSQSNQQTSVDFRRYSYQRPNRTVPYKIADDLSSKLAVLMQRLGLETGSLDLVKTVEGRFVFLEVNPVGQFGMVSYPCNYHLEHTVASALVRRLNDE